jgi:predicted transcriptional regulator of viral defense system
MNIHEIRKLFFRQGVFSVEMIQKEFPKFHLVNLHRWLEKGYIHRIRKGWYFFDEVKGLLGLNEIIANTVYQPSYIGHQQALNFYGLIPEAIVWNISMTTKKTYSFVNTVGNFRYYSIRDDLFFGYHENEINFNGMIYRIRFSDLEKAILDVLYHFDFYEETVQEMEELRFDEIAMKEDVDWNKLYNYLEHYKNKTLERKIEILRNIHLPIRKGA